MASSPTHHSAYTNTVTQEAKTLRNPISVRLYKVLGNNFDDDATREALQTLTDLYVTPPPKSKEIVHPATEEAQHDEQSQETSPRVAPAPQPLLGETVPGESAAKARKNLRWDMENKLTNASKQFLESFKEVDQNLDELQKHINAMRNSCNEAERQLNLAAEASGSLLERAGSLREERQAVEEKRSTVLAFLDKFTLNAEESKALTSREVPIGQIFFDAMDKTERIRDDCRILMGEDGPTQAGQDIMAATSNQLEQGYEKISRWCSNEFRQIGRELHVEVTTIMRETVRRLQQRPELLSESLTYLMQTRQVTLLSSFITALTRGGPSGLPRPIELHAHDPLRYVGDMLAWVHQAIAAEQEFLEALFGTQNRKRMVGSVRTNEGKTDKDMWVQELMDSGVEKLCVPLKARVQQTVKSQESCIVSYKIANLLQFYMLTIHHTIGDKAILSRTLLELTDFAYVNFYESITAQAGTLAQTSLDINDSSLTPPLTILDHMQILREIMAVYHSSLLGDEDENEQIAGFEKILDIMVDPVVEICTREHQDRRRLGPSWDHPVFILNCLTYLDGCLEPFSFTQVKRKGVGILINDRVSMLTEEHYQNIMADAGLLPIIEACKNRETTEPLSRLPGTQPNILQAALQNFSLWLSSIEVVQSSRLHRLTVQQLRSCIHHDALERMVAAYTYLCDEVRKTENRYEAAATLLGSERPFGQVHLLKQIFGLEE